MPAWSPDSKKLAFVSNRTGNNEIFIIGADGLLPKQITDNTADDISPAWSPDGKKLAFVTKRDQNNEIYIYDLDTEQVTNVTNNLGNDETPAWSGDGSTIAFVSDRADNHWDIYTINPDGSNIKRLTNDDLQEWKPAWKLR